MEKIERPRLPEKNSQSVKKASVRELEDDLLALNENIQPELLADAHWSKWERENN